MVGAGSAEHVVCAGATDDAILAGIAADGAAMAAVPAPASRTEMTMVIGLVFA